MIQMSIMAIIHVIRLNQTETFFCKFRDGAGHYNLQP